MTSDISNEYEVVTTLEKMPLDELRLLSRRLRVSGYSTLRKVDLINHLASADQNALRSYLYPSWWDKYHNHVYGVVTVIGVILTIAFFVWPNTHDVLSQQMSAESSSNRVVPIIENPISFGDYSAMTPDDRQALFNSHIGKQFVWEGYLSRTIGFEVQTLTGVPFETDVSLQITPFRSTTQQLYAEFRFGELLPTDSGYELASRLDLLIMGQRLRLSGRLDGTPDTPIFQGAFFEAVFPFDE